MTRTPVNLGTDWAELWIDEARRRLEVAKAHNEPQDRRPFCEQAHYTAEYSINAVLVARGTSPRTIHDIGVLLDQALESGEEVPDRLRTAQMLTQFAGAGRYQFARGDSPKPAQPVLVTQAQYAIRLRAMLPEAERRLRLLAGEL